MQRFTLCRPFPPLTSALAALAFVALTASVGRAAPAATQPAAAAAEDVAFDYVPQANSAPAQRIHGASRAGRDKAAYVCVLAPDGRVGLTAREQPVLYWYLSQPLEKSVSVELAVTPIDPADKPLPPLLDLIVDGPLPAGVHRLDLAKPGGEPPARLKTGTQYKWVVTILNQTVNASGNPGAACRLERVAPPAGLPGGDDAGSPAARAGAYARAGLWFEALDALNKAIDANPTDPASQAKWRAARRGMFKSQGLDEDDQGRISDLTGKPAEAKKG